MLGAIIGDIVGSVYEGKNFKSKDFEFFSLAGRFTDDSLMTLAVGKALVETSKIYGNIDSKYLELLEENSIKYMQHLGRKYPACGFSSKFRAWIFNDNPKPYESFGNGSAMRVSSVVKFASNVNEVKMLAETVTKISHNHPQGLKGAEATALAVFMAKIGSSKEEIKRLIEKNYYNLDFTIAGIRDSYEFNATCQGSVPQAIVAFLESQSFEDAIRNAISLGGDSDTLAAIAGSIAEEYYGIPEEMGKRALGYLNDYLLEIYEEISDFNRE